jgi:hypothetical protein
MKQELRKVIFSWIVAISFGINSITVANAQTARVKSYKVSPTLSEIINLKHFIRKMPIGAPKRSMLGENLFAVSPTRSKQLFHIYEDNDYKDIPSFVSTDSVLQLYHIFFSFTLRSVEEQSLTPVLHRLTEGMLSDSIKTWNEVTDTDLKRAALKNVACFTVAARNLGMQPKLPSEA